MHLRVQQYTDTIVITNNIDEHEGLGPHQFDFANQSNGIIG